MTHKLNQLNAPGSGASRFAAPKCSFTVLRVARPRGSGRLRRLVRTKCQRRTGRRWHCQGFRTPASCPSCLVGPGPMTSRFQFDGVASRSSLAARHDHGTVTHEWNLPSVRNAARSWTTVCPLRFLHSETAGALPPPIPPPEAAPVESRLKKPVETDCGERPHFRIVRTVRTCPMPAPWGHSNCLHPGWPY
jgi:hypothetical protein